MLQRQFRLFNPLTALTGLPQFIFFTIDDRSPFDIRYRDPGEVEADLTDGCSIAVVDAEPGAGTGRGKDPGTRELERNRTAREVDRR